MHRRDSFRAGEPRSWPDRIRAAVRVGGDANALRHWRRAKVAFGECAAGARLQVLLEPQRTRVIRKHDRDVEAPWTVLGGVRTEARVVPRQTDVHIRRYAGVMSGRIREALENVNDRTLGHDGSIVLPIRPASFNGYKALRADSRWRRSALSASPLR